MLCAANPEGISLVFRVYFRTLQTKPVAASGKMNSYPVIPTSWRLALAPPRYLVRSNAVFRFFQIIKRGHQLSEP